MQGEECSDSGGGDEVVPAGMTDLRQCVVFGEDRDRASVTISRGRAKTRLDTEKSGLDLDAS